MSKSRLAVKTLTHCAILIALAVILARFLSFAPNENTRYSLESLPIFLSGVLFGPVAGILVGFASDFIGCLFSPFGFNPIFSLPPILYGLCGGLMQSLLTKKVSIPRIALGLFIPALFGSVLWQSFVMNYVYGKGFLFYLATRSVQFAIIFVVDTVLCRLLFTSGLFRRAKIWPPLGHQTGGRGA